MAFTIYPAIDLRHGKVVRLVQGKADAETVYGDDPVETAAAFQAQGARWLHVVNLDGAFGESTENLSVLKAIADDVGIPIQFGGGLRSMADVDKALSLGASRVILGTAAVRNPQLVRDAAARLAGSVVVGIDARDGKVAVEGWTETSDMAAPELARRMFDAGVSRFIYTDIARDGMEVGPDLEGAKPLAAIAWVIASGGVGKLEHVAAAKKAGEQIDGLIIGKALYEHRFTLRDALLA
ncbi:MAG: 1-(5-phosphoribosyl)-5-[(5-phosphoribosylamino)methylideneamino]imidazole-4-carboxamide isomerase [Planctomycetes bacterium]|nr:1-(5-phosphoribosyl)-5-[(5-phosphoribosylamino)methylideneamino]imidazole-4-carboxamide isomerase [Planctomycetota bacterium]